MGKLGMIPPNKAAIRLRSRADNGRFARQAMFIGLCVTIVFLSASIVNLKRRSSSDRQKRGGDSAFDHPRAAPIQSRRGAAIGTTSSASSESESSSLFPAAAGGLPAIGAGGNSSSYRGVAMDAKGGEEEAYAYRYARTRFYPPPAEAGSDAAEGGGVEGGNEQPPMFHRLPNVLLIGAQKAGTTSVSNFLVESAACKGAILGDEPEFYSKEVQFFNDEDRYSQGLPFYSARYAHCDDGVIMLDATPNYLTCVRRIRQAYDDAGGGQADRLKVIAILREPISRELSWYNHLVYQLRKDNPPDYAFMVAKDLDKPGGQGAQVISFGQYVHEQTLALLLGPARRYDTATPPCHQDKYSEFPPCFGLYAHFLEEWFDWFDRDRVLVLSYDELVDDPDALKGRLVDFLGLDKNKTEESEFSKSANKHASSFKLNKAGCAVTQKLKATFEKPNKELYELLEKRPGPPMEQRPFPRFSDPDCEGA